VTQYEDLRSIGHFYPPVPDKWKMNDIGVDFIYTGSRPSTFMLPMGLKEIVDYEVWKTASNQEHQFPLFTLDEFEQATERSTTLNFIKIDAATQLTQEQIADVPVVLLLQTDNAHAMPAMRRFMVDLIEKGIDCPVVIQRTYSTENSDELSLFAATDCGGLLVDGLGDGIMLSAQYAAEVDNEERLKYAKQQNSIAFGILQAGRTRMSKTEYISCPSCGRTLFDLQETTALIRKRTDHLKGVKIGIMGCIVNGPGEMADADYGYVGIGKDKIALYRGQQVVKKSVVANNAVDELINIIKEDGKWFEPEAIEL
jgi:(E)-4-hydroxy-3-methylbut-2-enyl-diphosphate synthase